MEYRNQNNNSAHYLNFVFIFLCCFAAASSWSQNSKHVLFNADEYKITANEQKALKGLYTSDLSKAASIQLIGHTDSDGSDTYNATLSQKRVDAVKKRLVELGCDPDKISIAAKGESTPLNANKNADEKEKNRRVEIIWQNPEAIAESSIQDLYDLLEQQKQSFCINPKRDTILKLDQGTIIVVPAGAFETRSKDCILLKTKEVYKYSDMLMENLSTTSNGRLIESAGMVYTEASDLDGNKVNLKPGAQITVMIPTDSLRDDMELFTGQRDPTTNQINWIQAGSGSDFSGQNFGHDIDYCNPYNYEPDPPACVRCGAWCRIGRFGRTIKGAFNDEVKGRK